MDAADGLGSGRSAEGDFEGIQAAVKESLGEGFGIFSSVDGDDGDDTVGKNGSEIEGRHRLSLRI